MAPTTETPTALMTAPKLSKARRVPAADDELEPELEADDPEADDEDPAEVAVAEPDAAEPEADPEAETV